MPATSWDFRLRVLTDFTATEAREPLVQAASPGERRLALWLEEQRRAVRGGRLSTDRVEALTSAGLVDRTPTGPQARSGAVWLKVAGVAGFLEAEGRLPSLTAPRSAGEKRLAGWVQSQLTGRGVTGEPAKALHRLLGSVEEGSTALAG